MSEITETTSVTLPQDIVTPLSSRALFWRAHYLAASPFLVHVPFLFWVMDVLRPSGVVQLGLPDAVGYFALCQAADKLDLDARLHGIHLSAEGARLPADVIRYNETRYREISRLTEESLATAPQALAGGPIDLLVVDMPLEEAGLAALEADWLPRLAESGLMLIAQGPDRTATPEARAFLERLGDRHACFRLEAGDGLLAVLAGARADNRLQRLAELELGMPGHAAAHRVFARLGAMTDAEHGARAAQDRIADLTARCAALEAETAESVTRAETLQSDLVSTREALSLAATTPSGWSTDPGTGSAEGASGMDTGDADMDDADRHAGEIRLLTTRLAEARETQALADEARKMAEARLAESEFLRAQIIESTSWKIMAPARRLIGLVRRNG